ncbi:MAG: leucine-rich repeat domain-containing protein, partial [Treponema sp.]|nr:leucine-rich repeat domain-containing protein [Treponema sp.]
DARSTSMDDDGSEPDYIARYVNGRYFEGCSALLLIQLPDWMLDVVDSLFNGCANLASVTLSPNTEYIGVNAFNGCSALVSITLPASVTDIAAGAFVNCASGFAITYQGTKVQWGQVKRSNQSVDSTKWHDGDREISDSTGHVTCGDGACGLDYKYIVGTPDITALDDASDLDFCSTVNVSNVAGFNLIAQWADSDATDFHNVTIVLQDDVTVEDNYWIKQFRGTFDGNNHTITQNYTTAYGGDAQRTIQGETLYQSKRALFWSISTDAVIKNITVEGTAQKAGLVGHMYGGSIEDCVVDVTVSGNSGDELGGFVSKISGPATIKNCVFKGSLATPYDNNGGEAGGIVGSVATNSEVIIENCLNKGAICTTNEKVAFGGGIVGYCDYPIIIRNCKNTGNVRGKYAGGIIGHAQRVNVINCNNLGNITKMDTGSSGGIVGQTSPSNYDVVWPTLINNCNYGSAEGGIVGDFNCPSNNDASKPQPTNEYISHNYYYYVSTNPVGQVNSKYSWSSTSWGDSYFIKVTDDTAVGSILGALDNWAYYNSDDSVTYASWTGTVWDVRLDLGELEDK